MLKASISSDLRGLIEECWSSEEELYNKWHYMAGRGLDVCVDATFNDVKDLTEYELFRVLNENEETVGMFGIEKGSYLTGFFIKPKFRKKEFVLQFMALISSRLRRIWFTALYEKNTRAIKFFEKLGAENLAKVPHNGQNVVILQMTSGEL